MRVNDVLETHCTWNIKPDGDNIHREENRNKGDRPMRRPSTYFIRFRRMAIGREKGTGLRNRRSYRLLFRSTPGFN